QRGAVCEILLLALLDRGLQLVEPGRREGQRHRARKVLNRTYFIQDLLEPGTGVRVVRRARLPGLVSDQPVERLGLDREQVRNLEVLGDPAEGDATRSTVARRTTH